MSDEILQGRNEANKEIEKNLRVVGLGIDLEVFKGGPVGRYLLTRANSDAQEAILALCVADPENPREIRRLQNIIERANSLEQWIDEAIAEGNAAQRDLEQRPDW